VACSPGPTPGLVCPPATSRSPPPVLPLTKTTHTPLAVVSAVGLSALAERELLNP